MKTIFKMLLMQLVVAFLFTAALSAQKYSASIEKTTVNWKATKVVAGGHTGTINLKSGTVTLKDGMPEKAEIVIDMSTMANIDKPGGENDRLVGHLKSDDFFGVESFPLASFVMKSAESTDNKMIKIAGDLTIKGKTNPVSFMASLEDGGELKVFSGTIEVDRSKYDVKYGSGKFFDNLGDKAINDIFTLEFKLYLMK